MTGIDWSKCAICETNPLKMGGVYTVRDIRMSADAVVENWEAGVEPEEIVEQFGLELDDVTQILAYAKTAPRLAHPV